MQTTRKKKPKKIDIPPKRMKQLNAFAGRISPVLDLPVLLTEIYRELLVLFGSRDAAILLTDTSDMRGAESVMYSRRSEGFAHIRLDMRRSGIGQGIAEADGVVVIEDVLASDEFPEAARVRAAGQVPGCVLGAPLVLESGRAGLIAVGRPLDVRFSTEDKNLMTLVVEHVAHAVQNAFRFRFEKLCSLEWVNAVDALKEGILVHDRSFRILRANRRFLEMVGMEGEELAGRLCRDVLPRVNGGGDCPYCRAERGKEGTVSSCIIKDEDDKTFSVVHVVKGESPDGLKVNGSLESIGSLISGIAHEVKSPLTGIIGYSELALEQIRDKKLADDKVLDYLNRIHAEGNRAYRIIHDLLYFARREPPETGRIRLNEMLLALLEGESRRLKKSEIVLKKNLGDIPDVWGDPRQIQQVFANILSNAIQACLLTEGNRELEVETAPHKDGIIAAIRDTGPGIPKEIRQRIFDPFFGTENFSDGIGLGLSVAYGIVTAHGGEIQIEDHDGRTEIRVRLPVRKES